MRRELNSSEIRFSRKKQSSAPCKKRCKTALAKRIAQPLYSIVGKFQLGWCWRLLHCTSPYSQCLMTRFVTSFLQSPETNITMNTRAVVIFHCIPRQKRLIATTHLPWCSWKRFVYTYFKQGCSRETWSMMDDPCFIACTMVPFGAGSVHWNHGDHVPFRKLVGKC